MAKYTISHLCGHDQVHQLIGPHRDRDAKIQWMQGKPCSACWQVEQRAKRDAEGPKWRANVIYAVDPQRDHEMLMAASIRRQIDVDRKAEFVAAGGTCRDLQQARGEVADLAARAAAARLGLSVTAVKVARSRKLKNG